jgi:hypothetical protein
MGPHIGESFGIDLDAPVVMCASSHGTGFTCPTSLEEVHDHCKAANQSYGQKTHAASRS